MTQSKKLLQAQGQEASCSFISAAVQISSRMKRLLGNSTGAGSYPDPNRDLQGIYPNFMLSCARKGRSDNRFKGQEAHMTYHNTFRNPNCMQLVSTSLIRGLAFCQSCRLCTALPTAGRWSFEQTRLNTHCKQKPIIPVFLSVSEKTFCHAGIAAGRLDSSLCDSTKAARRLRETHAHKEELHAQKHRAHPSK